MKKILAVLLSLSMLVVSPAIALAEEPEPLTGIQAEEEEEELSDGIVEEDIEVFHEATPSIAALGEGETYTIHLDYSGFTYEEETEKDLYVTQGDSLETVIAYLPDDYVNIKIFAGWMTESGTLLEQFSQEYFDYIPTADETLTAVWADGYKIHFDYAGYEYAGLTEAERILECGHTLYDIYTSLPDDIDNHKIFAGWRTGDGEFLEYGSAEYIDYIPTGNDTLTAVWTDVYILHLDYNGFEFSGETKTDYYVPKGDTLEMISAYLPDDYVNNKVMCGWDTGSGDELVYASDEYNQYVLTGDTTFTAVWRDGYHLTFDLDGYDIDGEGTTSVERILEKGHYLSEVYPGLYEDPDTNRKFIGWRTESGTLLAEGEQALGDYIPSGDETYTAVWGNTLVIHVDYNGFEYEGNTEKDEYLAEGTSLVLIDLYLPDDEEGRKILTGWRTESGTVLEMYSDELDDYVPTTDETLTAVWSDAYMIHYDYNGVTYDGRTGIDKLLLVGHPLIEVLTHPGNAPGAPGIFWGWTTESGEYLQDDTSRCENYIPSADETLTAVWGEPLTGITLDHTESELNAGNTLKLVVSYEPSDTQVDKTITWVSSDNTVATVSPDGTVTAVSAGTVTITASCYDKKADCIVQVKGYTGVKGFVYRLYVECLNREPDPAGLNGWTAKINNGMSGAEVAYQFMFSKEYLAKNTTDTSFVKTMYAAFFDRTVAETSSGFQYFITRMENGLSREWVFKQFVDSTEFANMCTGYGISKGTTTLTQNRDKNYNVTSFVQRAYKLILNRPGDESGLNDWTGKLLNKQIGGGNIVARFMASTEFKDRKAANGAIVDVVYKTMLNRVADPAGKADWVNILNTGVSTDYLVKGFAASAEFTKICNNYGISTGTVTLTENRDKNIQITKYVARCYEKALGRSADTAGLNYWCGVLLTKTMTASAVAHNFVFSKEVTNKNLSNTDFINMLYRVCLDREADASGRNYWLSVLNSGVTRENAFNSFAASAEFKNIIAGYGL